MTGHRQQSAGQGIRAQDVPWQPSDAAAEMDPDWIKHHPNVTSTPMLWAWGRSPHCSGPQQPSLYKDPGAGCHGVLPRPSHLKTPPIISILTRLSHYLAHLPSRDSFVSTMTPPLHGEPTRSRRVAAVMSRHFPRGDGKRRGC